MRNQLMTCPAHATQATNQKLLSHHTTKKICMQQVASHSCNLLRALQHPAALHNLHTSAIWPFSVKIQRRIILPLHAPLITRQLYENGLMIKG